MTLARLPSGQLEMTGSGQSTAGSRPEFDARRDEPDAPPRPWERAGIAIFFIIALGFGAIVVMRSAYLNVRMTDLDVYLRAAWAVRTGSDPYTITDDRGWHYHYPPLFAIALIPLADPPPGRSRAWTLPFAAAAALWYGLNLLFLAFAVNCLASALERTGAIPPPGSRSWWSLRIVPILVCLGPVGVALERGQADLLLLALLCAMIAAIMRGRAVAAGMWLAGAICLKLIPAYLLIYPLWRRDWRMLASCGAGLVLGLILIPAAFFGPSRALTYAREWNRVLIEPAMFGGTDTSRSSELLDINATDNQSFVALIHRWHNLDETLTVPRPMRTRALERWARPAHWLAAAILTAITLLAAWQLAGRSAIADELLLGALCIVMIVASPVSHLHYFVLALPAAMGLLAICRTDGVYPDRKWLWFFAAVAASGLIALLPRLEALRDLGMAAFGALALWACAVSILLPRSAAQLRIVDQLYSGGLKPRP